MKTSFKSLLLLSSLSVLAFACKEATSDAEITEADVEFASAVMGATLSDETDGLMASAYDASASVDRNGLTYGSGINKPRGGGNGEGGEQADRGQARNFVYTYDAETGTHTLSMERSVTNQRITKSMTATLKHIYTHESGAFVRFPKENRDSVNSIYFTAVKAGSDEATNREAAFSRIDTMSMVGLNASSATLALNGSHSGSGSMTLTTRNGDVMERTHDVFMKLTNVLIDKEAVTASQNLEQGITGTIEYKITSFNSRKDEEPKVIEGTIEMTGDGTALMRFKGLTRRALINLTNGSTTQVEG